MSENKIKITQKEFDDLYQIEEVVKEDVKSEVDEVVMSEFEKYREKEDKKILDDFPIEDDTEVIDIA